MLKIPSALREQFELCLRNKPVPVSAHGLYIKWLRYYLDFCLKYDFASDQRESLPHFLLKLQEKNRSKVQQQQAAEAITFYYELILSMGHNEAVASPQETISSRETPGETSQPPMSSQKETESPGDVAPRDKVPYEPSHTPDSSSQARNMSTGASRA